MNIAAAQDEDAGWEPCGVTRQRQAPIQNSLGATEVQIALQLYATPTVYHYSHHHLANWHPLQGAAAESRENLGQEHMSKPLGFAK